MHAMIDNGVMEKEGNLSRWPKLDDVMRILVTGSGGRLGRLLFAARNAGACPETEFIFQSTGPNRDLCWAPEGSFACLPASDTMIALWGKTSGTADEFAVNSELVGLSRRVAQQCGVRRLFHISTAAVYGPGKALSEDVPLRPIGPYGQSKLTMERVVQTSEGDVSEHVLRLANVVGADSLAPALIARQDVTLDQFADGRGPLRSYIGATDLLEALHGLSKLEAKTVPFALNIAAPAPVAMEDLAIAADRRMLWRPAPDSAVKEVSLDVTRMQALLPNSRPSTDAEELIAELDRLERHG